MIRDQITLVLPELTFEESTHTYMLEGQKIPGVTELMKPLSQSVYKNINQGTLETAAARGSAVHEAIENYAKFGIEDCEPELRGYFDAFLAWAKKSRAVFAASEIAVYNKTYRYAGTIDLLCWVGDELWLVDVKTTAQVNEMLTSVQLVAYDAALATHGVKTARKIVLHLKKDGKHKAHIADKAKDAEAWTTFGALMTVKSHIDKFKKG